MTKRRKIVIRILLGLVVIVGLISLYTEFEYTLVSELRESFADADSTEGAALGELLFQTRGCSGCHTLGNLGSATFGPDLTSIVLTATAREIRASITDPNERISENCPDGPCVADLMPAFGEFLDEREIEALVSFLLAYTSQSNDDL